MTGEGQVRGCGAGRPELDGMWGIVLAAGKGERLKSDAPKPAVVVGGQPMVARVVAALHGAGVRQIAAVVGHRAEDVRAAIADGVVFVTQEEARGTGHATRQAEAVLKGYQGPLVVAYSDLPLLRTGDIRALVRRHLESKAACTLLTAVFERPGTLGRIVRGGDGGVVGIVEARDATEEQLHIKEINVGVYCFQAPLLFQVLRQVRDNNAQRQYYLTDAIGILVERGERVEAVTMERAAAGIGVDTQEDLARAQALSGSDEEPG